MTSTTSPLPASLLRAEARQHDLDARIQQAEQRLIAREEGLRRRAGALGKRVALAWQPSKLLAPLLVVGGVTTLGWLWSRRPAPAAGFAPSPARPSPAQPSAPAGGADSGAGHWVHWLPMLWPLLPPRWRESMPASLRLVARHLGLPLLEVLVERHHHDNADMPAR
jgi:hypothetical protein